MKILICTGVYPPDIGGPAEYAKNLFEEFKKTGHIVRVATYRFERKAPTGLRHLLFLFKAFPKALKSDFILALDTFSSGLPAAILGKLTGKKVLLRVGGDFLWETYTERGGKLGLRAFYQSMPKLVFKEKIIHCLLKFTLKNSCVVFTTDWQREIFEKAYNLDKNKVFLVENFYGEKIESFEPKEKNFIVAARKVKFKNLDFLRKIFDELIKEGNKLKLEIISDIEHEKAMEKIQKSYAAILISISDIGPNFILDVVRANKPFILTKETGLYGRLKDVGIFVDPFDKEDIKNKILFLAESGNYEQYRKKVAGFNFTHSWREIADEFLEIYKRLIQSNL